MKLNQKLAIAFLAVGTGVFGLSSGAFAGSGGAAGGAAFTVDTNHNVTGVAVSAAVGKDNAAASAFNNGQYNSAFSLGSAGTITIQNMSSSGSSSGSSSSCYYNGYSACIPYESTNSYQSSITGSQDYSRSIGQNNDLTGASSIKIGTTSGAELVNIPGNQTPATQTAQPSSQYYPYGG